MVIQIFIWILFEIYTFSCKNPPLQRYIDVQRSVIRGNRLGYYRGILARYVWRVGHDVVDATCGNISGECELLGIRECGHKLLENLNSLTFGLGIEVAGDDYRFVEFCNEIADNAGRGHAILFIEREMCTDKIKLFELGNEHRARLLAAGKWMLSQ